MSLSRDTRIGYPAADASVVTVLGRLETLIASSSVSDNLGTLIAGIEEQLVELRNIRELNEVILGTDIEK